MILPYVTNDFVLNRLYNLPVKTGAKFCTMKRPCFYENTNKHELSLRARRSQNNIMRVPSDKSKTNYLRMKIIFIGIFVSITLVFAIQARGELPDTTVFLPEVSVNARKVADFGQGHFSDTIHLSGLRDLNNQDLGSALRIHSGLFIRSYGPGGLAVNSLRGGAASQTAIIWNGFNLNSPMNGQLDLSQIPSIFLDEVIVQHGGSSAILGNSAMSGAVFLNNTRNLKPGFFLRLGINGGSHGEFAQTAIAGITNERFSSTFRFFHKDNENRYLFPNFSESGTPSQTQQYAEYGQIGVLHQTWLRIARNHQLDFTWWLQDNNRNIAPPLNFPTFHSQQQDENLRMSIQYTLNLPEITYYARAARFEENILYSDVFSGPLTYNFVSYVGETEVRWSPGTKLLLTGGVNFQNTAAEAMEYQGEKKRNTSALFLSANWAPLGNRLRILASARQEFLAGQEIPFSPSIGFNWMVLHGWNLRGNASYSFRLPSLNDLYWIPGGNPALKPEEGWNYDLRIEYFKNEHTGISQTPFLSRVSIGGYWREIKNWIIWLPQGDSWLWMPENRAKVRSYGIETLASGSQSFGKIHLDWRMRYEHTIAKNMIETTPGDPALGRQLIYVPRNRGGLNLTLRYYTFSLIYNHSFTGKSYTTSDNTESINGFNFANASIKQDFTFKNYRIGLSLSVENIWNNKYQILAHRPMPFRIFRAGLQISIGG